MFFVMKILDQKFEYLMGLLLISNHYVYIKDFGRFMFSERKNKNNFFFFCKSRLQCFSSKNVLREHKKFV